jgi:hypothetical protein
VRKKGSVEIAPHEENGDYVAFYRRSVSGSFFRALPKNFSIGRMGRTPSRVFYVAKSDIQGKTAFVRARRAAQLHRTATWIQGRLHCSVGNGDFAVLAVFMSVWIPNIGISVP